MTTTMTKREQLIEDAKAAGYTVTTTSSGVVEIVRRHKRWGTVLQGIAIYPDGTAADATVDASAAKVVRSYAVMREILGL